MGKTPTPQQKQLVEIEQILARKEWEEMVVHDERIQPNQS